MAIETAFIALFSFVAMLILERGRHLNKDILLFSPVTGFLVFGDILALRIALRTSEASGYAPITRLGFAVTFLLAVFVFGEKLTVSKGVGVLLVAVATFLLSLDI